MTGSLTLSSKGRYREARDALANADLERTNNGHRHRVWAADKRGKRAVTLLFAETTTSVYPLLGAAGPDSADPQGMVFVCPLPSGKHGGRCPAKPRHLPQRPLRPQHSAPGWRWIHLGDR